MRKRIFDILLAFGILIAPLAASGEIKAASSGCTSEILPYDKCLPQDNGKNTEKPYGKGKKSVDETLKSVNGGEKGSIIDAEGVKSFRSKALKIVNIITGLIFGFAVITVVFAGFKLAHVDIHERKLKEAKIQILMAGIGMGIALFAQLIIRLYQSIIGIQW